MLVHGAVTAGRGGETLAPLGELADAGVVGFSDDGSPVANAAILRNALAYAGSLGLPIIDHPEDPTLTEGAEANEGYVGAVLGLKGWPASAEAGAVARAIAILADVVRDVPAARLHLTHVSTAAALAHVRAAKAAGLPVTCDVTPHHLALTDEWIAGSRRWAWEALDDDGAARDPWADGALEASPFDPSLRVNPPLRAPVDAAACLAALVDGTADAIATDHAPHTEVDKHVEFGLGGERDQRDRDGDRARAGGSGRGIGCPSPARSRRSRPAPPRCSARRRSAPACAKASRRTSWSSTGAPRGSSTPTHSARRARTRPLLGRELRGVVRLTLANGRVAYAAD